MVPDIIFNKLRGVGIKIHTDGLVSKESLISVLSHRRSTSSYSSKNRIERANNNCLKPEQSTLLEELYSLIPDLVSDSSSESDVDSMDSSDDGVDTPTPEQNWITTDKWFWARKSDDRTQKLKLVYLAQISQPKYYQRKQKQKMVR